MANLKLVFFGLMVLLACAIFITPLFFPERKEDKDMSSKRLRIMVRIRMGCFLGMLVLLLLCVIL